MTAPVIRQYSGTIPDKGQAQTAFDTNVDAFLDWQALQFAPDLVAFGEFASDTGAALVAGNLPPLTGRALDAVRVNAAADGVEFVDVTAAGWALLDDANATAQRTTLGLVIGTDVSAPIGNLTQPQAEDPASTVFGTVSGQRLAQAVSDNLNASGSAPIFACRAWVNFKGTDTVTIRASGNVSSITDNGAGDYTINFTTAMSDANYAVVTSRTGASTSDTSRHAVIAGSTAGGATDKTASGVRVQSGWSTNSIREDAAEMNVIVMR